ncbi:MAG: PadR family transcriptional regulator [Candidatus Korarchaeum sp.]|nr:PadR family transcriptional regulator [Candidatus Korarchaeum sp.]MDW8036331.1 PadR family transcriptional regulator [Candidatus Korarchaeum sp.]
MKHAEEPILAFLRGSYRLLILALLEQSKMHGYQIMKLIERMTGHKPKISTFYSILNEMERRGFLSSQIEDERRIYKLTDKGKLSLSEFRSKLGDGALRIVDAILKSKTSQLLEL